MVFLYALLEKAYGFPRVHIIRQTWDFERVEAQVHNVKNEKGAS